VLLEINESATGLLEIKKISKPTNMEEETKSSSRIDLCSPVTH